MNLTQQPARQAVGALALAFCGKRLPLQVLRSAAGYYIGTFDDDGPCSRESEEYWSLRAQAEQALATEQWTQKVTP